MYSDVRPIYYSNIRLFRIRSPCIVSLPTAIRRAHSGSSDIGKACISPVKCGAPLYWSILVCVVYRDEDCVNFSQRCNLCKYLCALCLCYNGTEMRYNLSHIWRNSMSQPRTMCWLICTTSMYALYLKGFVCEVTCRWVGQFLVHFFFYFYLPAKVWINLYGPTRGSFLASSPSKVPTYTSPHHTATKHNFLRPWLISINPSLRLYIRYHDTHQPQTTWHKLQLPSLSHLIII